MIAVIVMFPGLAITEEGPQVDPSTIDIEIPGPDLGGSGTDGATDDGVPPPPSFD
jgi:hypothetical protein